MRRSPLRMSIGLIGANGNNPYAAQLDWAYNDLYQRILQQTGSAETAQQAVANARNALSSIYHDAVVRAGGDESAGYNTVNQYTRQVMQLAGMIPSITGGDTAAATASLRQATSLLEANGMRDRSVMYQWLREHVTNDEVLRGAGFDPAAVKRVDSGAWAYADTEALLALARDALVKYRGADGRPLTNEYIDSMIEQGRAAARRYGVGSARTEGTTAGTAAGTAAAGTVTVAAFNFPRRV